ncbi:TSUP family transporter [Acidiphilium sp. PM]|uniref:TSUP family transporter n=1 Tax=Acidiphilium sp. PM TaxID=1043206 RepID=UPI00021454EB|nr:TSUP family transporter [Acidiphilium sp. PM]EGO95825.1 hypothetical protein APM_1348 [Acidiphilium sp. PM]
MTFFLAGIIKGVLGLSMPVITMGVPGVILSPAEAASLLLVPSFATDLWQFLDHRDAGKAMARFWPMMAGVLVVASVGSDLLAGHDARPEAAALGASLAWHSTLPAARWPCWRSPSHLRWRAWR